ncbi:MAG TPA: 3'-5' exonuclease [Gemmatimonadaceae bacterium]|nr:3'-5' exonuclease [Gemmatimonadaceae bacterium]
MKAAHALPSVGRRTKGVTLGRPASPLADAAFELLASGPLESAFVVAHVCHLPAVPSALADHLATAILGADDRFARRVDGRWGLAQRAPDVDAGPVLLERESFVVVDVETTGTSALRGDRVTEVAVVLVRKGKPTVVFDTLVNPERPIPARIAALTHITSEMVRDAPRFAEIAPQLSGALEGHVFVAHNAAFDWRFLSTEMQRATGRPLLGRRLCTVRMARMFVPALRRRSLDVVAGYFGIPNVARHRAGGDALATAHVLVRLLDAARDAGCSTVDDVELRCGVRTSGVGRRRRRRASALPHSVREDTTA